MAMSTLRYTGRVARYDDRKTTHSYFERGPTAICHLNYSMGAEQFYTMATVTPEVETNYCICHLGRVCQKQPTEYLGTNLDSILTAVDRHFEQHSIAKCP